MAGSDVVEGFRGLVKLYKAVLECYERHVKLGGEAGEKLASFAKLSPSELRLKEAVSLMESALQEPSKVRT